MTNDGTERVAVGHPHGSPNESIGEKNVDERIRAIRRRSAGNAFECFKGIVKEAVAGMIG